MPCGAMSVYLKIPTFAFLDCEPFIILQVLEVSNSNIVQNDCHAMTDADPRFSAPHNEYHVRSRFRKRKGIVVKAAAFLSPVTKIVCCHFCLGYNSLLHILAFPLDG